MHLIIPNFAVRIAQGVYFRKRYGFSIRKCTGIGKNNEWNHPKHPSGYPRNLIQCHLLRSHSPRIYIRSFPNFLCPYPRACAFGKWWEAPFENERLGAKNPLQITIRTPAGFGKWWGGPFENARIGAKNPSEITLSTPAGTTETLFNATF